MRMVRRFRCNRLQNRAAWAGAVAAALTGAVAQAAVVQVDTVASTNAFVLRSSATTDQSEAETLVT